MFYTGYANGNICPNRKCKSKAENATRKHKQLPLPDLLSHFLISDSNQGKLEYKEKSSSSSTDYYADFYDGQIYQKLKKIVVEEEKNTIDLAMYVDGFLPFNSSNISMTLVMFCILNLPPQERSVISCILIMLFSSKLIILAESIYRYKEENLLIICVPTGRNKPSDIFSYLCPTLQQLMVLENHGMDISTPIETLHYKARLCLTIGDIPGVAELCRHGGHTSYKGCRICKITGTRAKGGGMYFPNITNDNEYIKYPIRSISDYKIASEAS
jgi:hypothetical protein